MFETLCRHQLAEPSPSFPRQAGRRECTTSTVTWQPKECTRYKEKGTNSSQRTRDKSAISTRGKWKITIRDLGKKTALTERVVPQLNKLLCYGISILGATQELLGKGPNNLNWLLSCIYNEESSAVTGLDQTTSPPSLIYSMIWSHSPPHVQDSKIWEQKREDCAVERGDTFSATDHRRRASAEQGRSSFSSTPKILFPF